MTKISDVFGAMPSMNDIYYIRSKRIFVDISTGEFLTRESLDALFRKQYVSAYDEFQRRLDQSAGGCVSNLFVSAEHKYGEVVTIDGLAHLNMYKSPNEHYLKGNIEPFINHVKKLLPNEQDAKILISYLASCLRYRGKRLNWCVILQGGVEGGGKTFFQELMLLAVGEKWCHVVDEETLSSKFNGWMVDKFMYFIEEIRIVGVTSTRMTEKIKTLITGRTIDIEKKGVDRDSNNKIFGNWFMTTNHKDAISITEEGRRYCFMYAAQQSLEDLLKDNMDAKYFKTLYDWLFADGWKHIAHYLMYEFELEDALNPTVECIRAPRPSCFVESMEQSRPDIDKTILDAVNGERPGFRRGWVNSEHLRELIGRVYSTSSRSNALKRLGYVKHPALKDGRATREIGLGQTRPYLWIQKNSEAFCMNAYEAMGHYLTHNGET